MISFSILSTALDKVLVSFVAAEAAPLRIPDLTHQAYQYRGECGFKVNAKPIPT